MPNVSPEFSLCVGKATAVVQESCAEQAPSLLLSWGLAGGQGGKIPWMLKQAADSSLFFNVSIVLEWWWEGQKCKFANKMKQCTAIDSMLLLRSWMLVWWD